MSGEKLKATKSEIAALDEQLAAADIRRKQLKGEAATRRAKTKIDSQEARNSLHPRVYPLLTTSCREQLYLDIWQDNEPSRGGDVFCITGPKELNSADFPHHLQTRTHLKCIVGKFLRLAEDF